MIPFILGTLVVAKAVAITADVVGAETGAGTRKTFLKHASGLHQKARGGQAARREQLEEDLKLLRGTAAKGWRQLAEHKALGRVVAFTAGAHLWATGEALSAIADNYLNMAADFLRQPMQPPSPSEEQRC